MTLDARELVKELDSIRQGIEDAMPRDMENADLWFVVGRVEELIAKAKLEAEGEAKRSRACADPACAIASMPGECAEHSPQEV